MDWMGLLKSDPAVVERLTESMNRLMDEVELTGGSGKVTHSFEVKTEKEGGMKIVQSVSLALPKSNHLVSFTREMGGHGFTVVSLDTRTGEITG